MNLSRGWLTFGRPRRFLPACICLASSIVAFHPALAIEEDPADRDGQAAEADVLPGIRQPAAPDLELHGESESKASALASFSQAILAEDNADSDTALADYQKALALDPGYTELAVKVAFELTRRGDPSSGIQVLKDSIKASPKAPLAYLYLSQLYAKNLGKPDLGLKYAQQSLDLDPASLASYVAVYEIYGALKQPAKAAAVLDRAATQPSTDPQYWLQLGDYYLKTLGSNTRPDQLKKAATIYNRALPYAANDPVVLARIADFDLQTRHEADAIPLYLKAIKFSPANPPDGDDSLNAIRDNLARCFITVGRTEDAIATLKQLIHDNPLRRESYELLCDLYEKAGQTDPALDLCQQMLLLDPSDFRVYIRIAALQMKKKQTSDAIKTLTDARAKFPSEAEVSYSLGLALSEAKRFPEALSVFEQTVQEAADGQTQLLDAQFYFAYGAAAEQSGQVEKAATLLKKSIDLDPQSAAEAYNYLGFMWVDRGLKLDEAGELIKKALQMDPGNPAFVDSLGWYYFKKGDFKQALVTLKKAAASIQPEDAVVEEHLGDAYSASNDTSKALDCWQRAASLDKDNKDIAVKIAAAKQKLAGKPNPAPPTQ